MARRLTGFAARLLRPPIERPTCRAFVRSQETRKLSPFQNQPFGETPWAAASLVFQVYPTGPGTRMPKGFPKHRQIISLGAEPNNMPDTDSIRIAPLQPVGDAQRAAPALLAPANEKALIPSARRQLIPDKRRDAARMADRQPGRPVAARRALPPIPRHIPRLASHGTGLPG